VEIRDKSRKVLSQSLVVGERPGLTAPWRFESSLYSFGLMLFILKVLVGVPRPFFMFSSLTNKSLALSLTAFKKLLNPKDEK